MRTIEQGFEWLSNHKPDIAFIGIIGACIVWITSTVINFNLSMDALKRDQIENRNEIDKVRKRNGRAF